MTVCDPATVVLVRFPFTDLSSAKKRPAVVLSSRDYAQRHGDVVLIPLTSVPQSDDALRLSRWQDAGLLKATWIKPIVATVSQSLIERTLGSLHDDDRLRIRDALHAMLAPVFRAPS